MSGEKKNLISPIQVASVWELECLRDFKRSILIVFRIELSHGWAQTHLNIIWIFVQLLIDRNHPFVPQKSNLELN